MGKISRNEPCPCGSGKKYKKCCLKQDETDAIARRKLESENIARLEAQTEDPDELDNLSNSVLDLIKEKKWDEAQDVCNELLKRYPDQVDGLERFAVVYDKMGEKEKAIEYYKKSAEFAKVHDGFDPRFIEQMLDRAKELEAE